MTWGVILISKSTHLPLEHVNSRRAIDPSFEDDVTASVREAFGASISSILALLKERGALQRDIAVAIGIHSTQISRWRDGLIPRPEVLDAFIAFANQHLKDDEKLEPGDLFRGLQLTRRRMSD